MNLWVTLGRILRVQFTRSEDLWEKVMEDEPPADESIEITSSDINQQTAARLASLTDRAPEVKRAGDLTVRDIGRLVRIQSGSTVVTGKLSLVSHLDIQGWRAGGREMTSKAYVSVGVGSWTNVIHYAESVVFPLEDTAATK